MRGKKKYLARVLDITGICNFFLSKNRLYVLCYHRVASDEATVANCAFDGGVYGCTIGELSDHLKWLKKNTSILDLDGLIALLEGKERVPGPYSMITFDDGYQEIYSLVYFLLKKLQVPAIVFVPTQFINEGALGWWDLIAFIFKHTSVPSFEWQGRHFNPSQNYDETLKFFLDLVKYRPAEKNANLVGELAELCQLDLPSPEIQAAELLNWDQLKIMSRDGVEIGSHTHTHRVLTTLNPDEQREELLLSKKILKKKIDQPVRALAYPVGGRSHFDNTSQLTAQKCGYEVAFSFGTGCCELDALDFYDLSRFEPGRDCSMLASQCAFPGVML